jgi:DNA-binding transcriptional ArsR family regulator
MNFAVYDGNQARIKTLVSLLPGIHLRHIQRLVGLSFSSTRYHVERLARTGEILLAEEGRYSRLYPVGTNDSDKALFSLMRRPTDRRILTCMVPISNVTHRELCDLTGLAKSTVSEHLSRLVRMGAVLERRVNGSGLEYELKDPSRIKALISSQNPTLLRAATRRYIDLWDF